MRSAKSIDMVIGIIRDDLIGMDFNDIVATLSNFGKAYVGFGESLDAENNSLQAVKNALKSPLFSYIDRAIKKHGWKNFSVEIIETCETLEQLNEREKFWIREFNCKKPNGYNLTDGGEGIPGYKAPPELSAKLSAQRKGRKISTEQSEKISATMTGREFTDEHKANISAAKMGHPVSDETRAKLAAAQTGKKASAATRAQMSASAATKRSVRCIETGKIFPFMKDAMAWAKISRHVLRKACLNISIHAPRVGCDVHVKLNPNFVCGRFQSTHPCGVRRWCR